MDKLKLTSVKILKSIYDSFKLTTVNTNMTLQKLANRSIHRYLNDPSFKEEMNIYTELNNSGSCL